ncbi:hypothetical protein TNCV_981381 [Trichonephila clavipes]|uniref:Uncharacterized protein n=1 Tax=Trichonephila clavipes TaxID=2585209 RepID=A0A8X6S1N5_TRICX|nr:hypothetical protein TNCV_981381 [Trichonephila clavipes]
MHLSFQWSRILGWVQRPWPIWAGPISHHICRLGGLGVACQPRKPKVESSIPEGVNRFSECENHRHACHMIMWRAKDPLSIHLCLVLSVKLHYGNGLASDESMNYNLFKREIW